MFIVPINPIGSVEDLNKVSAKPSKEGSELFKDVLQGAINNVVETGQDFEKQQYLMATGEVEDTHSLTIAAAKAQLSVDMMVQLRNKTMEAYSELMRLQI